MHYVCLQPCVPLSGQCTDSSLIRQHDTSPPRQCPSFMKSGLPKLMIQLVWIQHRTSVRMHAHNQCSFRHHWMTWGKSGQPCVPMFLWAVSTEYWKLPKMWVPWICWSWQIVITLVQSKQGRSVIPLVLAILWHNCLMMVASHHIQNAITHGINTWSRRSVACPL